MYLPWGKKPEWVGELVSSDIGKSGIAHSQNDIGTTQNSCWTWRLLVGTRVHCTGVPELLLI